MSLLEARNLQAFYGDFQALFGIDLAVEAGETVAVIGANGAGKSTFLNAIAGLLASPPESVLLEGRPIGHAPANAVVALGIALVPEGRRLFPSLTVEENLLLGGFTRRKGPWDLRRVHALFPALAERRAAPSTSLSGGQQQMVAIGRALLSNPRLLLCDEISLGLAPLVIRDIYAALAAIKGEGTTILLVEQDVDRALAACDRLFCFQEGRVSLSGRPAELARDQIRRAYFGL